jgi:pimeloyl-ACP methyl ester carboxylesterase
MKIFIKNRDANKVCVIVEKSQTPGKLAFVMHGLGGNKNQGHIRAMVEAFLETGYTVVTFDTTNTFGESGGNYEDATITNYYADLEDVIKWASEQAWYTEPFVLCGHSLGGISTALFAEAYPQKIQALAPISTVVSGKLSLEVNKLFPSKSEDLDEWKRKGIRVTKSYDGKIEKRLKWSHMEDRLNYDLLLKVDRLTMPVLMVVGARDYSTPLVHQQILFDQLPGDKELHVIEGALHSFYEPHEQQELKQIVKTWAAKLDS